MKIRLVNAALAVFLRKSSSSLQLRRRLSICSGLAICMILQGQVFSLEVGKRGDARLFGRCVHVVDGDSLYLQGLETQIRLWGVDAPERDETGYQAAKEKLYQLAQGKSLECVIVDVDKYQRLVARCYTVNDNKRSTFDETHSEAGDINRQLITSGVAEEYCYFRRGYYGKC